MVPRKRGRAEMEASESPQEGSALLVQLRNTWQFANIMQFIYMFGKEFRIDEDFDIEDLEAECIAPGPHHKLTEIGLCLLKTVSSHRGLTPEIFDEYMRRQYVAKRPHDNPFGTEETPNKFDDFTIFMKLKVLVQLSQWTMLNAERFRERMTGTKDTDQTNWRMEEIGYDRDERLYFVFDDNRLYRRTPKPLPLPPTKARSKAKPKDAKVGSRASKRRKTAESEEPDVAAAAEDEAERPKAEAGDDGLGGDKWECLAVTLGDYHEFLENIRRGKDADEKALYHRLTKEVLPVIEKLEEERQKKMARRQRELLNMEKLATAKRSSRIASKQEKDREEQEAVAAERKRRADLTDAKKDAERQKNMDEARKSRMMTREQRLREREYKRILHEEELANLSEDGKKLETGDARMSERQLKVEMAKKKRALEALALEDQWFFDCAKCGVHGHNLDDGTHSVACEKCNVWQHSACLDISQADAEKENFHFVCDDCRRREEDSKKPKIPALRFRLGASSSPPSATSTPKVIVETSEAKKRRSTDLEGKPNGMPPMKKFKPTRPSIGVFSNSSSMHHTFINGPTLSPQGQLPVHGMNGRPPPGLASPARPIALVNGCPAPPNSGWPLIDPNGHDYFSGNAPYQTTLSGPRPASTSNALDQQSPLPSHSRSYAPSPVKGRPSMSPPRGSEADASRFSLPSTPAANIRPFPQKHSQSFRASCSPGGSFLRSPSPHMPPPTADTHSPLSGRSPVKNSPPRRPSGQNPTETPVLPPAARLSPSPQVPNLHVPVKGTPEQNRAEGALRGSKGGLVGHALPDFAPLKGDVFSSH